MQNFGSNRRDSAPRRARHAKTSSCITPGLFTQSPRSNKSTITGKRISNNGALDLSQEFDEIKRIVGGMVAKLIFAARPRSTFGKRMKTSNPGQVKRRVRNGKGEFKWLATQSSGAEAKISQKKEPLTEKKSTTKKRPPNIKTVHGRIVPKREVQKRDVTQTRIPISHKMKLLIQQKITKKRQLPKPPNTKQRLKLSTSSKLVLRKDKVVKKMSISNLIRVKKESAGDKGKTMHSVTPAARMKTQESEAERRAKLGLTFVDLQNRRAKPDRLHERNKSMKDYTPKEKDSEDGVKAKDLAEHKKRLKPDKKTSTPLTIIAKPTPGKQSLAVKSPENAVRPKTKKPKYIQYLIPEKKSPAVQADCSKTVLDPQVMNDIRVELLSEIVPAPESAKSRVAESEVSKKISMKSNNLLRGHANDSKIKEGNRKDKERVDLKIDPNLKTTYTQPKAKIEAQIQTDTCNECVVLKADAISLSPNGKKEIKSPLREMRLMVGSEKKLEASMKQLLSPPASTPPNVGGTEISFDKKTFNEFTLNKLKLMLKSNDVSAIIGAREEAVKHKESSDKRYIHKMFKAKKITPKEYQRKRKEIEKWVNKEKEDIKRTKTSLLESWRRTEEMIEDANTNAAQLRKLFAAHTLSYNSDTNSSLSLLDSQRAATDRCCGEEIKIFHVESGKEREALMVASDEFCKVYESDSEDDVKPFQAVRRYVEVPELVERSAAQNTEIDDNVELMRSRNKEADESNSLPMTFAEPVSKAVPAYDKETLANDVMEHIYAQLIEETFSKSIPKRVPLKLPEAVDKSKRILLEALSTMKSEGIRTDQYYINKYIDDLFLELSLTKNTYLKEINTSIKKQPLEALRELQCSEETSSAQLPQDANPIIPLSVHWEVERKYEAKIADELALIKCMHAHNKAIFDSVNEALNLIRPYGLNGEPMPWSSQGRVLFRDITDRSIIVRNIKNIVLDWVSFEVGTLPSPEFLFNGKFDEEYFIEVREKQLAVLLAQEVVDNEDLWINYDMEEAEVELDITDMALEALVVEAIEGLVKIKN